LADRYARQAALSVIGAAGQEKLRNARAAIVGVGALGSVSAGLLARAGVGYLRLIDRDICEITNLQRQLLYDESDVRAKMPKAAAAAQHVRGINSDVAADACVSEFNSANAENLLAGFDIVLDGSDSFAVRSLINDVCVKHGIPWVYAGALGTAGAVFAVTPAGACFHCLFPEDVSTGESCAINGVMNTLTAIAASYQVTEAFKVLTGAEPSGLLTFDIWSCSFERIAIERDENCPVCAGRRFAALSAPPASNAIRLCGEDTFQVPGARAIDLAEAGAKLCKIGEVSYNEYRLTFENEEISFTLFPDGRAFIHNTKSAARAKAIYTEYIG